MSRHHSRPAIGVGSGHALTPAPTPTPTAASGPGAVDSPIPAHTPVGMVDDGDGETDLLDATSLAAAAAAAAAEMTGSGETDLHIDSTLFALSEAVKEAQQESARYAAENLVKHENEHEADAQAQVQVQVQVSHDQEEDSPALQLHDQGQVPLNASGSQSQEHVVEDGTGTIHLDDDGIDPALREIVNSLTAQQSVQPVTHAQGMSNSQAAAVISAHLAGHEHDMQAYSHGTLDDLAQSSFGGLFPSNFAHSPTSASHFLLPEHEPTAESSSSAGLGVSTSPSLPTQVGDGDQTIALPLKRGRGRPKGSKNKPKLVAPPPKPPRKVKEKKPIGRPRKIRSAEEEAEFNLRLEEKRLGIKRKQGRPRKYDGYLVREMRLKKNRAEFAEVIRRHAESERDGATRAGEEGGINGEINGNAEAGPSRIRLHDDGLAGPANPGVGAGPGGMDEMDEMEMDHQHQLQHHHHHDSQHPLEGELERTIDEHYDWEHDPQSLLEVVGRGIAAVAAEEDEANRLDGMDVEGLGGVDGLDGLDGLEGLGGADGLDGVGQQDGGEPSGQPLGMGRGDEAIRVVFGLEHEAVEH